MERKELRWSSFLYYILVHQIHQTNHPFKYEIIPN